jgi:G3E family GTPase
MIKLVLLTGFLGTGKTTLMQRILDAYKDSKVGVIVNEFGEVNIDAVLIKKDGIKMTELTNGSIFCACIKENFVSGLIEMSNTEIEYLFIEASGLADPANMAQILHSIESKTKNKYDYRGAVCIVDAETFLGLYEMLPALHNQIEYSDVTLINKSDLVDDNRLTEVSEKLTSINPETNVYMTSYCKVDVKDMIENLGHINKKPKESTNKVESRPKTFILKSKSVLPYEDLVEFINNITNSAYRIKGFAETDKGPMEVSAVGEHVKVVQWKEPVKGAELVVISAIGIKLISIITREIEKNLKGKIHL